MFTLCVLSNLVLKCRPLSLQRGILLGTVIVAIVVVGEEFSQIWIPDRSFDLLDLTADFVGITAGNLVARRIYPVLVAPGRRSKDCVALGPFAGWQLLRLFIRIRQVDLVEQAEVLDTPAHGCGVLGVADVVGLEE